MDEPGREPSTASTIPTRNARAAKAGKPPIFPPAIQRAAKAGMALPYGRGHPCVVWARCWGFSMLTAVAVKIIGRSSGGGVGVVVTVVGRGALTPATLVVVVVATVTQL